MEEGEQKLMKIVLDTNIIFDNWFLDGPNFKVVEQLIKLGVCELVIPQIVIFEVKNKYREELKKNTAVIGHLNTLLPIDKRIAHLNIDELCNNYEAYLTKKLRELKAEIPSYSDIPQDDIVARLFQRRKPFNKVKTSDRGYRDALLWEVILRNVVKKGDTTFLITNNVNDFAEDDKPDQLHEDLREDLKNIGLDNTAVCLCSNLTEWVSVEGTKYLETAALAEDLKDGQCEGFSLQTWFISQRQEFIDALNEKVGDILSSWPELEDPSVTYIEDPQSVSVREALMIDKDTIFLRAEVFAEVSIDVLMEQWKYDTETNRFPFMLIDFDWSEEYLFSGLVTGLPIRFSAVFDIQTKQISSFELDDIEIYGWCRHCGAIILSDAAERCYNCGKDL